MRPQRIDTRPGKGLMIVHMCVVCGVIRLNRIAEGPPQGDDIDAIIAVMIGKSQG